jgi:hypothetical protein
MRLIATEEERVRRNIIVVVAAVAVIAIIPATGMAGQITQAVRSTPNGDAKQDAAQIKPLVKKVNTLGAGFAAIRKVLNTAKGDVAILKTKLATAQSDIGTLKTNVTTAQGDISTLKTDDASTKSSITTINGALAAGATALSQINAALTNSTTGLVGLNAARPQFGAFANTGVLIAGTGQVTGASGPKTNATEGAGALADFYIVDFGNDVSLRFLQVTQFPTGGASTNRATMAVDCGASAAATTLCSTVAGSSDSSKNHVVVQFGSVGSGAADTSWEVAALSG